MATATASATARRSLRSRSIRLRFICIGREGGPASASPAPLLRRRPTRVGEDLLDLLHRVVDLHVERHLPERGAGPSCVAGDAVVLARWSVEVGGVAASG